MQRCEPRVRLGAAQEMIVCSLAFLESANGETNYVVYSHCLSNNEWFPVFGPDEVAVITRNACKPVSNLAVLGKQSRSTVLRGAVLRVVREQ